MRRSWIAGAVFFLLLACADPTGTPLIDLDFYGEIEAQDPSFFPAGVSGTAHAGSCSTGFVLDHTETTSDLNGHYSFSLTLPEDAVVCVEVIVEATIGGGTLTLVDTVSVRNIEPRKAPKAGVTLPTAAFGDIGTATVRLTLEINRALPVEGSLPVNRIRAMAYTVGALSTPGALVVDVDPNASSWTLDLKLLAPTGWGMEVQISGELVNVSEGLETVQWSGISPSITVFAGGHFVGPAFEVVRGPLDNLSVQSVVLAPIPQLQVGEEVALTATMTTSEASASPVVYFVSLDPEFATVKENRYVRGLAPGTARILAVTGRAADTATATVVSGSNLEGSWPR